MKIDLTLLTALARETELDGDMVLSALREALLVAYSSTPGADARARVDLDAETGEVRVLVRDAELGEQDLTPENFGRIASLAARSVVTQRLTAGKQELTSQDFEARVGSVVTGIVQHHASLSRTSGARPLVLVDLGPVEARLPGPEQVPGEVYRHGERVAVVVVSVDRGPRGPQVTVSRSHPGLVRGLLAREVPEVADGSVEIMGLAREAGQRSKVAVRSTVPGINPKGSCIGPRGSRVAAVTDALRGEKLDIVDWSADPAVYVGAALAPARVQSVEVVDLAGRSAKVVVPDFQLSLAIGRDGQNARLAARLTGWRIDIHGDQQPDAAASPASLGAPGA